MNLTGEHSTRVDREGGPTKKKCNLVLALGLDSEGRALLATINKLQMACGFSVLRRRAKLIV
jgi:hypothetical protein